MLDSISQGASSARNKASSFDSTEVFDTPQRKPVEINPYKAAFNIIVAFGLIGALITGYIIGLRVFNLGITAVGLYGTILVSEYILQLCCAITNRFDVDRIVRNRRKKQATAQVAGDCEKGDGRNMSSASLNPNSEVSIAVVGYREDEKAWRHCLRSLQTQTLRAKCTIGVVDGNEEPDLSMAYAFADEFKAQNAPVIHLPVLLSELHRDTYFNNIPDDNRPFQVKVWHYLVGRHRPGHLKTLALARLAVLEQVLDWNKTWNISDLSAVCFSQPHGHKRTAMFTAFAMSLYALRTRDAIFTTDSDTLVQDNGLDEMLTLLRSRPEIGGVTADVKIWNRAESLLTRLSAARYWFAFNIERACQSMWGCVGCLSGPMGMYRACDLDLILQPWNIQSFGGKPTTFGDDRHLTNQLLGHGLETRYTHRTSCDSESPKTFIRWIQQQTRWSKSFFREVFWFPASFATHSPWMLVETTIQALYPFILIATAFHLLFDASDAGFWRPVIWLITMFGIALFKSLLGFLIGRDLWLLLFSCYGFIYFFGLLPSKVWALLTMNQTGWGTSARSSSERKRGQSFLQRSFHVGHLIIWYIAVFIGLGFLVYRVLGNPLYFLISVLALLLTVYLYWNGLNLIGEFKDKVGRFFSRKRKAPQPEPPSALQVDESSLPTRPAPSRKASSSTTTVKSSSSRPSVETWDMLQHMPFFGDRQHHFMVNREGNR